MLGLVAPLGVTPFVSCAMVRMGAEGIVMVLGRNQASEGRSEESKRRERSMKSGEMEMSGR